jgi:acyl dehydratase
MRMDVDHHASKVAGRPGLPRHRRTAPGPTGQTRRESVPAGNGPGRPSLALQPDRGLVTTGVEVLNQHGQTVLTMSAMNLFLRRQVISRPG